MRAYIDYVERKFDNKWIFFIYKDICKDQPLQKDFEISNPEQILVCSLMELADTLGTKLVF